MDCKTPQEFKAKHLHGQVPEANFCNVRIEVTRSKADALGQTYVNAMVLAVKKNDWSMDSAPHTSYARIMNRINNGLPKDDGILFFQLLLFWQSFRFVIVTFIHRASSTSKIFKN